MSEQAPCTGVVIVAAGSGTRLGMGIPKAFVKLAGEPILAHALRGVNGLLGRVAVAITVPEGDGARGQLAQSLAERELAPLGERLVEVVIVDGGDTRHASVVTGLEALPDTCDIVLVHDAARALAAPEFFARIAGAVRATGHGIVPGLPVTDTVKRVDASARVLETVDRESLRAVQTPQGFPLVKLRAAYAGASGATTDDAATYAAAGGTVEIVLGEPGAFKITGPADLERAEELLARSKRMAALPALGELEQEPRAAEQPTRARHAGGELRVGVGTDIHAFDDVSPCWLAGIHFPGERGLSGHSDGDAASHAIVDALLGAAGLGAEGLGSIGSVFGTDDPKFANAHGATFLAATRELLAERGIEIQNVSVQVICKRPRFGNRAVEASAVLTEALGAPVSVSATTSDGLGFMGERNEGVFAIATALVRSPL